MFRTVARRSAAVAPLVATPNPSSREIHDAHVVSRLLGGAETFGSISSFTAILDKANGAVPAAQIGRAAAFLRRGDFAHALVDLDAAVAATASEKTSLHTMAVAMRAAVRNHQLDEAESKAHVSGAVEESELSSLRSQVANDLAELRKFNPNCWTIELAEAEYALYNGDVIKALPAFDRVLQKINEEIAKRRVLHVSPNEENELEAAVAHAANRAAFCENVDVSNIQTPAVKDAIQHHNKGAAADAAKVATLKAKYNIPSLTEAEVGALAAVNAASQANHHYYKMFPLDEKYSTWTSSSTKALKDKIRAFYQPEPLPTAHIGDIAKPETPYEGKTVDEVKKALASVPKDGDVLDHLESQLGSVQTSAISSGDHAFHSAVAALDEASTKFPTKYHSGDAYTRYQDNFIVDLLKQATYRVQLGQALCLERKDELEAAVNKLNAILKDDEFLYMWKVLLARGRVYKAQGKLDDGEKDFKRLHELKKNPGVDIPQLDANRWKSQF